MKTLVLSAVFSIFFFLSANAAQKVDQKAEKIKTSITPMGKEDEDESHLEIPHQIPNLEWDPKGIQLIHRDIGKQKFSVILKGTLKKHKVESFTYQVDGFSAHKITLKDGQFNVEVPLEKSPAVIRLWLEVMEGRAVRIYSDMVHVRSDLVPGAGEEKQINY